MRQLAGIATLALAATAFAGDGSDAEWRMDGGNAGRTSFVNVEPVRADPVELWRVRPDDGVLGEPVVAGGVVFVASATANGRQVVSALDARSGAVISRFVRLDRAAAPVRLAIERNVLVVDDGSLVQAYNFTATRSLKSSWKLEGGAGFASPCGFAGLVYFENTPIDAVGGFPKRLAVYPVLDAAMPAAPVSIALLPHDRAAAIAPGLGAHPTYGGRWLTCHPVVLGRCSGGVDALCIESRDAVVSVASCTAADVYGVRSMLAIRLQPEDPEEVGAWILDAGVPLETGAEKSSRLAVHIDKGRNVLVPGLVRPAVLDGVAYTFDGEEKLLAIRPDGTAGPAHFEVAPDGMHERPSAARGVLYFGDWALDVATRRVLWKHEFPRSARPLLPAIPLGDGLLLVRTSDGALVALGDPSRPVSAAPAPAIVAPTTATPTALPTGGDGVLLRGGRRIEGQVMINGDTAYVAPFGTGATETVPMADVVLAETAGTVLFVSSESDVHAELDGLVSRRAAPRYEELVKKALDLGLVTKARETAEAGRRWGLSEPRIAEILKRTQGRKDPAMPGPKLTAFGRAEAAVATADAADVKEAMTWCAGRRLRAAGGALAARLDDVRHPGCDALAPALAELVPPGFADAVGAASAGRDWKRWSPVLLATDGVFVEPDDEARARTAKTGWGPDVLAFRTRNLLFLTNEKRFEIVSPCILNGEAAVRGLHDLLSVRTPVRPVTDDDRLEVRLHATRAQYLKEAGAAGASLGWTLGYFAPEENVSRFFVPDASQTAGQDQGRGLFKVLAHELTHHYVEARWTPLVAGRAWRGTPIPGYWLVEGIARFMEDQIVDSGVKALTFEDTSALSLTLASHVARAGKLLPFASLLDMDQDGFGKLDTTPRIPVTVPRMNLVFTFSEANLFYEEAGALVFFLRNQCGAEGRKLLVSCLRDHYAGKLRRPVWRALGYATAFELEEKFEKWLESLTR